MLASRFTAKFRRMAQGPIAEVIMTKAEAPDAGVQMVHAIRIARAGISAMVKFASGKDLHPSTCYSKWLKPSKRGEPGASNRQADGMNERPTATWGPKQEQVALLIAAGRSIKAAAEADCGERTAHTWLEDPRYRTLVSELRHRMLDQAVGTLAEASNEAVRTLRKLLDDGNSGVRLRAATSILEAAVRMRQHIEFEARILRLEQDTAQDRGEGRPRIAIPDADGRWARTPPPQALDG